MFHILDEKLGTLGRLVYLPSSRFGAHRIHGNKKYGKLLSFHTLLNYLQPKLREIGMKTKRKLAPKSNVVSSSAGSGEHNVFRQCGYNNVCNVLDPSVSSNTQCAGDLTSVPHNSQELEVSRLPHLHLSVPLKRRCTRQLKSASCRVEGLSTSDGNGQHSYRTNHVVDAYSFLNQSSGHQERNTCLRITRESTIGRDSLRRHSRASGVQIDESINNGRGPYVFKISGQLYHWIGSLCPAKGEPPRFLQLYIYDTDNEVNNRMSHFGGDSSALQRDIIEGLIDLLDTHNVLVQLFRTSREKLQDMHIPNFKVRLYNVVVAQEYKLPTRDMLGAIVYEPGPKTEMEYDIILKERSG
nr:helitron helicase-like domain-containing protein [Tanacetum cinerariifolium]